MERKYITHEMRQEIEERIQKGQTVMEIAYNMKMSQAAIYAELKRGAGINGEYSAARAQKTYEANIKRRGNRTPRKEQPA